jgi:hypothetical protein
MCRAKAIVPEIGRMNRLAETRWRAARIDGDEVFMLS